MSSRSAPPAPGSCSVSGRRGSARPTCGSAADAVFPVLATAELRLAVLDRPTGGALVVREEGEHRLRMPLADLAEDMTEAGVTTDGVASALAAWVAHRPVPDAAAEAAGIAVLDWTDAGRTAVGWTVVVRRDRVTVRLDAVRDRRGARRRPCPRGRGPPGGRGGPRTCGSRGRSRCGRTRPCPCWRAPFSSLPSGCWRGWRRPGWRCPTCTW